MLRRRPAARSLHRGAATRLRTALVVAVAGAAVLAGCSSKHHDASSTTTTKSARTTTTARASTTSSTGGGTSTSGGGGTTTTTRSGPPACPTSQLTASLGTTQGAAGHVITPVLLANHGTTTCVLQGYPGVSLLDGSGTQIGLPATRATRPVSAVTLAPGAKAEADLETQDQGIAQTPCWAPSASVKIYPPGQLAALTIPGVLTVCGNELTTTPMATPTS